MNLELHDEVDHLLGEWKPFSVRDVEATPFVAPSWMTAWWEHWGDDAWVLGIHERGRLNGLAPFALERRYGAEDLQSPNLIVYIASPRPWAGVGVATAGRRLHSRAGSGVEGRAE